MKVESKIEKGIERIRELDNEDKIQFIILYGSSARRKRSNLSDIDLAIGYEGDEKERFDFRIKASGELPAEFDIQIFQDLPLYVRKEVLKGELLFARDFREVNETALETIRDYELFEPAFLDYIRR